jgi:hypothetical protein
MRTLLQKFRSPISGDMLDPDVADILAAPVVKEAALLDAVRATGGDESVEKAAAVFARSVDALREAYGGRLPGVVKEFVAENGLGPTSTPETRREAAEKNARIAKAAEEIEWQRLKREHQERVGATPFERLEKAGAALDAAAAVIRKSDPSLSEAQAITKAYEIEPHLYTRLREAQAEVASYNVVDKGAETRQLLRDDAHEKLERAAVAIRKAEPSLTREQAYVRALEQNTDLYEDAR